MVAYNMRVDKSGNDPFFSVVIPLYNKEKHIYATLNSVLKQKLENFEIIVVNDGSTDNGIKEVEKHVDSRIKLVTQPNSGVSKARNLGVDHSNAEYIAFLDADDKWGESHLSELSLLIHDWPGKGLYSMGHLIVEDGVVFRPSSELPDNYRGSITNIFKTYARNNALVNSSTACVSKAAFLDSGGFPEESGRGEDIYLWLKLAFEKGMAHNALCSVLWNRDATNRSVTNRTGEIPFYFHYLSDLLVSPGLSDSEKTDVARLISRLFVVQAAGFRMNNATDALSTLKRLGFVQKSILYQAYLLLLLLVPGRLLLLLRTITHRRKKQHVNGIVE